jgi:hypothetical protein
MPSVSGRVLIANTVYKGRGGLRFCTRIVQKIHGVFYNNRKVGISDEVNLRYHSDLLPSFVVLHSSGSVSALDVRSCPICQVIATSELKYTTGYTTLHPNQSLDQKQLGVIRNCSNFPRPQQFLQRWIHFMGPDERSEPVYGCLWRRRRIDAHWEGTSNETVGEKKCGQGVKIPSKAPPRRMHPIATPRTKHECKTLHQMKWEIYIWPTW